VSHTNAVRNNKEDVKFHYCSKMVDDKGIWLIEQYRKLHFVWQLREQNGKKCHCPISV